MRQAERDRVSAPEVSLAPVEDSLRPLAEAFVPEIEHVSGDEWRRMRSLMEQALRDRPPPMRRQLLLFVRILDWLPLLRRGARLRELDPRDRREVLEKLQDSRFLLVRRGVWGLRTLVFMGYYARPEAYERIGYRAHPDGWEARREGRSRGRERGRASGGESGGAGGDVRG